MLDNILVYFYQGFQSNAINIHQLHPEKIYYEEKRVCIIHTIHFHFPIRRLMKDFSFIGCNSQYYEPTPYVIKARAMLASPLGAHFVGRCH